MAFIDIEPSHLGILFYSILAVTGYYLRDVHSGMQFNIVNVGPFARPLTVYRLSEMPKSEIAKCAYSNDGGQGDGSDFYGLWHAAVFYETESGGKNYTQDISYWGEREGSHGIERILHG